MPLIFKWKCERQQVLYTCDRSNNLRRFVVVVILFSVACCAPFVVAPINWSRRQASQVFGTGSPGKASAMKLENCNKSLSTGDKRNKNKVCGFSGRVSVCCLCFAARDTGVYARETATFVVSLKFRQGLRKAAALVLRHTKYYPRFCAKAFVIHAYVRVYLHIKCTDYVLLRKYIIFMYVCMFIYVYI